MPPRPNSIPIPIPVLPQPYQLILRTLQTPVDIPLRKIKPTPQTGYKSLYAKQPYDASVAWRRRRVDVDAEDSETGSGSRLGSRSGSKGGPGAGVVEAGSAGVSLWGGVGMDVSQAEAERVEMRRVRKTGIPFFRDESHRRPTRGLYRALMRSCKLCRLQVQGKGNEDDEGHSGRPETSTSTSTSSSSPDDNQNHSREDIIGGIGISRDGPDTRPLLDLRAKIRIDWRHNRHLTSIPQTRLFLSGQYDLLSALLSASLIDLVALNDQYYLTSDQDHDSPSSHLSSRTIHPNIASTMTSEPSPPQCQTLPQNRKQNQVRRPRMTGGYMRPTVNNPPLPRLKPQPESLSMMIHKRVVSRERHKELRRDLAEIKEDMRAEMVFWKGLQEGLDTDAGAGAGAGTESASIPESKKSYWESHGERGTFGLRRLIDRRVPEHEVVSVNGNGQETGEGSKLLPGPGTGTDQSSTIIKEREEIDLKREWLYGWNSALYDQIKSVEASLRVGLRRKEMKFDQGMVERVERKKKERQKYLRDRAQGRKG